MDNSNKNKNKLILESSPYLQQHARNPVNWYPWGKEAFDIARQEDKMVLVSIGYSSCHWCHVMAHESFEDEEVAAIMNDNFICIKVDREERPDVDQVYMNAVQLLTNGGGWPLNCFALPDGSPVYGGTYFQKSTWIQVLRYMAGVYKNEKEQAVHQARQLKAGVQQTEFIAAKAEINTFSGDDPVRFFNTLAGGFDLTNGGFTGAPKFPMPVIWLFLLRFHYYTGNQKALDHTLLTLDKMAEGGIYDHLSGGFARYSTEENWKIPHFEKMLYDNAQLISLYSEAYQLTKKEKYKHIVYETIDFVLRELYSPEGAFYSSLDADSKGEEGKFYCWTKVEINRLLKNDAALFCDYYSVSGKGNWESGKNILFESKTPDDIAKKYNIPADDVKLILLSGKAKLLKKREKRARPGLDDKILASWNALMIKGLTDAYRVFGENRFLEKAEKAACFILENHTGINYSLKRSYHAGKSKISAFLDDYATIIDAFINLYKSTFNIKWLENADNFTTYTLDHFYDKESSIFFYTDDNEHDLIVRKMDITDTVIPSSNSIMANNLFRLGRYFNNASYLDISQQMLANVIDNTFQNSRFFSNWAILLLNQAFSPAEIVISGKDAEARRRQLEYHHLPEVILAGSINPETLPLLQNRYDASKTLIYVCENYACKLPVETVEEAINLLPKYKRLVS